MEQLRPVFSVHELNEYVDLMIGHDPNLSRLTVEGELSGCKRHPNGHLYFTLKDETASVACVMWRQYTQGLRFLPRDGMQVRLVGSASFYTRDGRFQLYATALQRQGEGDLFAAFCRYRDALKEAYRVLKPGGVLIFKCQDKTSSGKQFFSHCFIWQAAIDAGFYPLDLFILLAKSRLVADWQRTNQKHARKYCCFFWVFSKAKRQIHYTQA